MGSGHVSGQCAGTVCGQCAVTGARPGALRPPDPQNVRAQSAVTAACAERGHSRGVSRGVGCAFVFDGV